ncbi:MAG: chromosomal replication initiator protein DnaA [Prevotella sp.]|nr:chromosomal replication initiator protein DnaA [Prevotella sp.]
MHKKPHALWEDCLSIIRNNVTEQLYNTWFSPIVFESYNESDRTLVIQVPSQFVYEYLEEHYVGLLNKVLQRCFGPQTRLNYRIMVDKTHHITNDVEGMQVTTAERRRNNTTRGNEPPTVLDAAQPQPLISNLDPTRTFETFVEGDSNRLPRSVGLSIAEHPQTNQFNPMFVYGPSGCGKTHLLNAIGMRTLEEYPDKRVLYISAKLFQVQYSKAVVGNRTPDFINFYQTIDMLIVDDIQEWATATATQDTFFHIFNHLFRNGKRIILASDRPPVDLAGLNERLLTRFCCGLIAELEKPDIQLCINILHRKIKREGLSIPDDVVDFIARNANFSVRNLEGVVNSLLAFSITYNCEIDMPLAEKVIKSTVSIEDSPVTVDDILNKVCAHFKVSQSAIASKSRKRDYVLARQVSMYLARKYTKMPDARIGRLVGGRDHSTVIHSCTQVEQRLKTDKLFSKEIAGIENSFKMRK